MARNAANERRLRQRNELWPDAEEEVFDPDSPRTVGYTRMPRTIGLVSALIDELGGRINAGSLYVVLWCRDYGQGLIEVDDPLELLFEAGYASVTARGTRTWRERIRILEKFGFIRTKSRGLQEHGYILLRNPHVVVGELWDNKLVNERWWQVYRGRAHRIGLLDEEPVP